MKIKQHLIKQLQNGEIIIDNTGTPTPKRLNLLREILSLAFSSTDCLGTSKYYYKSYYGLTWACNYYKEDLNDSKPAIKVEDFLEEEDFVEQTLTRAQLIDLYNQFSCVDFKTSVKEILATNPLATDNTAIVIDQNYIDRLIDRGTNSQIDAVKRLGITLVEDKSVDLSSCNEVMKINNHNLIEVRNKSNYANKAFSLHEGFNWEIKKDDNGELCLVPTQK